MDILEHPAIARAQAEGYPEQPHILYCSKCGGEIYSGEEYGTYYEEILCSDCIEAKWNELTVSEKFLFLGYEVETA